VRIYLVRHGHAEEKAGKDDAARALTAAGRRDIAAAAPCVAASLDRPLRVICSPYLRAQQSAEILRELLRIEERLQVSEALLPESDWGALREVLERFEEEGVRSVIAVGHNPSISQICASIVAGSPEARIELSKGSVACLEVDNLHGRPPGDLRWLVTPSLLALASQSPEARSA